MESLTIGGLSMGLGMETNSHTVGWFQETVVAFEIVTAEPTPRVLQVTRESDVCTPSSMSTTPPISVQRAVHVFDVKNDNSMTRLSLQMTLNRHKDAVSCVLPLPNGDLITAGGKFDATMSTITRTPPEQQ